MLDLTILKARLLEPRADQANMRKRMFWIMTDFKKYVQKKKKEKKGAHRKTLGHLCPAVVQLKINYGAQIHGTLYI